LIFEIVTNGIYDILRHPAMYIQNAHAFLPLHNDASLLSSFVLCPW